MRDVDGSTPRSNPGVDHSYSEAERRPDDYSSPPD